jgi:hypothetical protein
MGSSTLTQRVRAHLQRLRAQLQRNSPNTCRRETWLELKLYRRNETYILWTYPHPHPTPSKSYKSSRLSKESRRRARIVTLCVNAELSLCHKDVCVSGGTAPRINYVEGHEWSASCPDRGKKPRHSLDARLGGTRSWSGLYEEKCRVHVRDRTSISWSPVHSSVTVKIRLLRIFPKLFTLLGKPHTLTHSLLIYII